MSRIEAKIFYLLLGFTIIFTILSLIDIGTTEANIWHTQAYGLHGLYGGVYGFFINPYNNSIQLLGAVGGYPGSGTPINTSPLGLGTLNFKNYLPKVFSFYENYPLLQESVYPLSLLFTPLFRGVGFPATGLNNTYPNTLPDVVRVNNSEPIRRSHFSSPYTTSLW